MRKTHRKLISVDSHASQPSRKNFCPLSIFPYGISISHYPTPRHWTTSMPSKRTSSENCGFGCHTRMTKDQSIEHSSAPILNELVYAEKRVLTHDSASTTHKNCNIHTNLQYPATSCSPRALSSSIYLKSLLEVDIYAREVVKKVPTSAILGERVEARGFGEKLPLAHCRWIRGMEYGTHSKH